MTTASDDGAKGPLMTERPGKQTAIGVSEYVLCRVPLGYHESRNAATTEVDAEDICEHLTANPQLRAEVLSVLDKGNCAKCGKSGVDEMLCCGACTSGMIQEAGDERLRAAESRLVEYEQRLARVAELAHDRNGDTLQARSDRLGKCSQVAWDHMEESFSKDPLKKNATLKWAHLAEQLTATESELAELRQLHEGQKQTVANACKRAAELESELTAERARLAAAEEERSHLLDRLGLAEALTKEIRESLDVGARVPGNVSVRCEEFDRFKEPKPVASVATAEQAASAGVEQPKRMLGPDAKLRAEIVAAAREAGADRFPWVRFANLLEGSKQP